MYFNSILLFIHYGLYKHFPVGEVQTVNSEMHIEMKRIGSLLYFGEDSWVFFQDFLKGINKIKKGKAQTNEENVSYTKAD